MDNKLDNNNATTNGTNNYMPYTSSAQKPALQPLLQQVQIKSGSQNLVANPGQTAASGGPGTSGANWVQHQRNQSNQIVGTLSKPPMRTSSLDITPIPSTLQNTFSNFATPNPNSFVNTANAVNQAKVTPGAQLNTSSYNQREHHQVRNPGSSQAQFNRTSRLRESGAYHLMNVTTTSRQQQQQNTTAPGGQTQQQSFQNRDSLMGQASTPLRANSNERSTMLPAMAISGNNYFNSGTNPGIVGTGGAPPSSSYQAQAQGITVLPPPGPPPLPPSSKTKARNAHLSSLQPLPPTQQETISPFENQQPDMLSNNTPYNDQSSSFNLQPLGSSNNNRFANGINQDLHNHQKHLILSAASQYRPRNSNLDHTTGPASKREAGTSAAGPLLHHERPSQPHHNTIQTQQQADLNSLQNSTMRLRQHHHPLDHHHHFQASAQQMILDGQAGAVPHPHTSNQQQQQKAHQVRSMQVLTPK